MGESCMSDEEMEEERFALFKTQIFFKAFHLRRVSLDITASKLTMTCVQH